MSGHIQRERLAETFITLCEISSPSRKEGKIANHLKEVFTSLGADEIIEDNSQSETGSESGNLIIRFNGKRSGNEGVFFACHMDTVEPGEGVQVAMNGDIFTSKGETILGGDDKSGIAAIIEMMTIIKDQQIEHDLIEIVITTCEEIGLLGAKSLDYKKLKAPYGYALDSSGIDTVVIGAPAANKFKIEITGAAAHAGLNPEMGISAIQIASQAITQVKLGRIDDESTANFGIIRGGVATNIVPEQVTIKGEVRSHSVEKLVKITSEIEKIFRTTVNDWKNPHPENDLKPQVSIETMAEYPALKLAMDSTVVERIRKAGEETGKDIRFVKAGGGSDANIFNGYGLPTAIIATGMTKVHTTDEQLDLNDLTSLTELICAVVFN